MMSLNSIFAITEEYGQSGGRNSEQCVQEHHNKAGHELYSRATQIIVKGFLCFLIIAPPLLFGQELTSSCPAFPDGPYEPSGGSATVGGVVAGSRDC